MDHIVESSPFKINNADSINVFSKDENEHDMRNQSDQ